MVLKIVTAGNPVLKKIALEVTKVDKRLRKLLDDMAETMYETDGVGIAAPQVGESIRAVVVDVGEKRFDLINPVITYSEGSVVDTECCLSCPELFGEVERAEKIRVEYTNRFNKRKFLEADGLLARCIQHEVDHLNGRLFIDIAKNITKGKPEK